MKDAIGAPVPRKEDLRLITGRGTYVSDLQPSRTRHVAFLRSPHAHCQDRRRCKPLASRAPRARRRAACRHRWLVTAVRLARCGRPRPWRATGRPAGRRPALLVTTARAGRLARAAGGPHRGRELITNRHAGNPMECRAPGAVAARAAPPHLLVGTQVPHIIRNSSPSCSPAQSASGSSRPMWAAVPSSRAVSRGRGTVPDGAGTAGHAGQVGRGPRRAPAGRLPRPRSPLPDEAVSPGTAACWRWRRHHLQRRAYSGYPWTAGIEPLMAGGLLSGPYRLANYDCTVRGVATNTAPAGPYRGVARPASVFAMESVIDSAARRWICPASRSAAATSSGPKISLTGCRPGWSTTPGSTRPAWTRRSSWPGSTSRPTARSSIGAWRRANPGSASASPATTS